MAATIMKRNTILMCLEHCAPVKMKTVLVFCALILLSVEEKEKSVFRVISYFIGEMVVRCRDELQIKNDVIRDLLDFWNEKNELNSTDLGCIFVCVVQENEFLNEDGSQVQFANVAAFVKMAGGDEILSSRMVELVQICLHTTKSIKNRCDRAREIAKCFRFAIFEMNWAPERDFWNHIVDSPDSKPKPRLSDAPKLRSKINKRKMFTKLSEVFGNK